VHANNGVLGFEFPNGTPPVPVQLAANKIADNSLTGNGTAGGQFTGDVTLEGGAFGEPPESTNNCALDNEFAAPERRLNRRAQPRLM
jgi:hypothetical protein